MTELNDNLSIKEIYETFIIALCLNNGGKVKTSLPNEASFMKFNLHHEWNGQEIEVSISSIESISPVPEGATDINLAVLQSMIKMTEKMKDIRDKHIDA